MKSKTKIISITVPALLLPKIDREASRQGRSRSNWLIWLFRQDLDRLGLKQENPKDQFGVADIIL